MKIKISILLLILTFFGCSANITKKQSEAGDSGIRKESSKKMAEGAFIDGSIYETKGQFKEAVEKYLEAAQYDPQPGIFYALAKGYYKLNKLPSAIDLFDIITC
jgi:tetratricopeptide (TPR) repeat protein